MEEGTGEVAIGGRKAKKVKEAEKLGVRIHQVCGPHVSQAVRGTDVCLKKMIVITTP